MKKFLSTSIAQKNTRKSTCATQNVLVRTIFVTQDRQAQFQLNVHYIISLDYNLYQKEIL